MIYRIKILSNQIIILTYKIINQVKLIKLVINLFIIQMLIFLVTKDNQYNILIKIIYLEEEIQEIDNPHRLFYHLRDK